MITTALQVPHHRRDGTSSIKISIRIIIDRSISNSTHLPPITAGSRPLLRAPASTTRPRRHPLHQGKGCPPPSLHPRLPLPPPPAPLVLVSNVWLMATGNVHNHHRCDCPVTCLFRHPLVPPVVPSDNPSTLYTPSSPSLTSLPPKLIAELVEERAATLQRTHNARPFPAAAAAAYEVPALSPPPSSFFPTNLLNNTNSKRCCLCAVPRPSAALDDVGEESGETSAKDFIGGSAAERRR
jgi:hypothetical protein